MLHNGLFFKFLPSKAAKRFPPNSRLFFPVNNACCPKSLHFLVYFSETANECIYRTQKLQLLREKHIKTLPPHTTSCMTPSSPMLDGGRSKDMSSFSHTGGGIYCSLPCVCTSLFFFCFCSGFWWPKQLPLGLIPTPRTHKSTSNTEPASSEVLCTSTRSANLASCYGPVID